MSGWLTPVRAVLDRRAEPVRFFFRDDDAGWDDARLFRLMDAFADHGSPLDLAVIPASLSPGLASELLRRRARSGLLFGLHQHGWSHTNHEAAGRKCEFGTARSASRQAEDIANGARVLRDALGEAVDPVFTPPWNRCTQDTADQLAAQGFSVLSRDRTATRLLPRTLVELPVSVDWTGAWNRRGGERGVAEAIGVAADGDSPVGIMLHHATMDSAQCHRVGELLALLRRHAGAQSFNMNQLAAPCDRAALCGAVVS